MEDKKLEQFNKIMQSLHKHKQSVKEICNIQHSEFPVLKLLSRSKEKPVTISEISEKIQISKPAVSQIINALEDKGFVNRVYTKTDRRVVYVEITEKGNEAIEQAVKKRNESVNELLKKLGEEDAETFLRLLEKISNILGEL